MWSQGRQQRTKQGDPTPLIGSTEHPQSGVKVGKRKAGLEAKALREGTVRPIVAPQPARKSKQTGFLAGRSQHAPGQGGSGAPGSKAKKGKGVQTTKPKRAPRKSLNGAGGDDSDLEGLKDEDDMSDDDEAFQVAEAKSLETARACAPFSLLFISEEEREADCWAPVSQLALQRGRHERAAIGQRRRGGG